MPRWIRTLPAALAAGLALAAAVPSIADDHGTRSVPLLPQYRQECAGCHLPYPPGLLPAASWQRLMQGLPQHFGSDASVDAATAARLTAWLVDQAGSGRRAAESPPEDRITRSAWFVREHRKVPERTWSLPAVRSAANCAACHLQAEQGDFDEHRVRLPR